MSYKIIEVHQVYQDNQLSELAVLWQLNEQGWLRASYCTTMPSCGYKYIHPGEVISPGLIQEVAGYGMTLPDNKKAIYFPGKRNWD